jgi:cyclic-di-GMP-binding protein
VISQSAPSDFQLKQMEDILRARLIARGIDVRCLEFGEVETNLAGARQKVSVKQGIERELAKKIQASLKEAKLKVDSQINGDKLRVTGKKRDDLQAAIAVLKAGNYERPLQFDNFRD